MNFITSRKEALDILENYIEKDIAIYSAQRNDFHIHVVEHGHHFEVRGRDDGLVGDHVCRGVRVRVRVRVRFRVSARKR